MFPRSQSGGNVHQMTSYDEQRAVEAVYWLTDMPLQFFVGFNTHEAGKTMALQAGVLFKVSNVCL